MTKDYFTHTNRVRTGIRLAISNPLQLSKDSRIRIAITVLSKLNSDPEIPGASRHLCYGPCGQFPRNLFHFTFVNFSLGIRSYHHHHHHHNYKKIEDLDWRQVGRGISSCLRKIIERRTSLIISPSRRNARTYGRNDKPNLTSLVTSGRTGSDSPVWSSEK